MVGDGRPEAAVAGLIIMTVDRIGNDDLQEYQSALRRYADELTS